MKKQIVCDSKNQRLGRLVDRHIREHPLVERPVQISQHAYQAGRAVETALHHLSIRDDRRGCDAERVGPEGISKYQGNVLQFVLGCHLQGSE